MPGLFISQECVIRGMNTKYLRVTLYPRSTTIHPTYDAMVEYDGVRDVRMLHWNVSDLRTPTLVFSFRGDAPGLSTELEDIPEVIDCETTPVGLDKHYLYLHEESTEVMRDLWGRATREGVVVLPPLRHTPEGGLETTVVGDPGAIQEGMLDLPDGIEVEVRGVGEDYTRQESLLGRLSPRQREAVLAAHRLGYYDTPRQATHEDIAAEIGCAESTASEHIRKAEAKLVGGVLQRERG